MQAKAIKLSPGAHSHEGIDMSGRPSAPAPAPAPAPQSSQPPNPFQPGQSTAPQPFSRSTQSRN
jgi:hypothetical protein